MLRRLIGAGLCLLVLLATGSGAKGIAAGGLEQGRLAPWHGSDYVQALPARRALPSNPISNDGASFSPEGLQAIQLLPLFLFLLTLILLSVPRMGRDPLSLTQRRRE